MIGVPARVTQPLGDIRVPFQGGCRRAEEFHEPFLWRGERHNPQCKGMISHRVNLTGDRSGAVGKDPAQHTGRGWIGVGCVGETRSHHADRTRQARCHAAYGQSTVNVSFIVPTPMDSGKNPQLDRNFSRLRRAHV